jgi:di/tricarboxylate transporter
VSKLLPFFSVRQRGVALLIFMLFIFLAATAWTLGQSRATGLRRQIDEATAAAMAQAKEALDWPCGDRRQPPWKPALS